MIPQIFLLPPGLGRTPHTDPDEHLARAGAHHPGIGLGPPHQPRDPPHLHAQLLQAFVGEKDAVPRQKGKIR